MSTALELRVEALEKELSRVHKSLEEDRFVHEYIFMKYFGEEYQTGNLLYQNRVRKSQEDVHGNGRRWRWSRRSLLTTPTSANAITEGSVVGARKQKTRQALEVLALEDCSEKEKIFVLFDYNHGKPLNGIPSTKNMDLPQENHQDPPHPISPTIKDPEYSGAVPSPVNVPAIEFNRGETADSTSSQGDMPIQERDDQNKNVLLHASSSGKNGETNVERSNNSGNNEVEMAPDSSTPPMEINTEFEASSELDIELFTQDKSFDCQLEDPVPVQDSNDPPSITLAKLEKYKNQVKAIAKIVSQNKTVENPLVGSPAPIIPVNVDVDPPTNVKTPSVVEDIQQEPMEQQRPKIPAEEEQSSDDSIVEVEVVIAGGSKKLPAKENFWTRAASKSQSILPGPHKFLPLQPPANDKSQIDISKLPVRQKRRIRRQLRANKANKRSNRICEAFINAGDDSRGYVRKLPDPNDSCDSILQFRKRKSTK